MQPDIISIGEPLLEFTACDGGGGRTYLRGYGGDTSNCIIAAARQGAKTGYVTAVSADHFGQAFLDLWRSEGVDCSRVLRNPNANLGVYFISPSPEGRNFAYFRRGSAASLLAPDDVPEDYLRNAKVLHLSSISQAISDSACDAVFHAIATARDAGVKVAYDTNLRLQLWPLDRARAVINETMRKADIALPSLDDSEQLTGLGDPDAIIDFYLSLGPSIVALKRGKNGAVVATPDKRERIAPQPVEALDATGAGDCFGGAFLSRLVERDDPFEAGRFANAAAALTTTGYGAVAPIPRKAEVEALLGKATA